MAREMGFQGTHGTVYYVLLFTSNNLVDKGGTFEVPTAAHYGSYPIALTEDSTTGFVTADMPIVVADVYRYLVLQQAGGSPAIGDKVVGIGYVSWDGKAERTALDVVEMAESLTQR